MTSSPGPLERYLQAARTGIATVTHGDLTNDAAIALEGRVATAWIRAVQEGRSSDFGAALTQMIGKLGENIRERTEGREQPLTLGEGGFRMSVGDLDEKLLLASFRSICPLWPFC